MSRRYACDSLPALLNCLIEIADYFRLCESAAKASGEMTQKEANRTVDTINSCIDSFSSMLNSFVNIIQ